MSAGNDIVSDVLKAVRLTGAIFFDVTAKGPWAAQAPPARELAPLVIPGAQSVLEYHVITQGTCWAGIPDSDEAPVQLSAGSIIVFPQGHTHILASSPRMQATVPDMSVYHHPRGRLPYPIRIERPGGDPDVAHMICGFMGYDTKPFNPLIESLPKMLHVPGGFTSNDGWLASLIKATVTESQEQRLGSSSILPRLSELIFIEVIRRYMESLPDRAFGWLAALRDPQVGRAIRLIHEDPRRSWSLADLAKEIGVSRSVFVERFSTKVGMAPMTYLVNWRMQLAAGMLAKGARNIARIAADVGYESEAAFSRAFKRSTGVPPAAWRSEALLRHQGAAGDARRAVAELKRRRFAPARLPDRARRSRNRGSSER